MIENNEAQSKNTLYSADFWEVHGQKESIDYCNSQCKKIWNHVLSYMLTEVLYQCWFQK